MIKHIRAHPLIHLLQQLLTLLCQLRCKPTLSPHGLDLANGSGQSGLGSTHTGLGQMGSGKKTGCPKWVAQPMTLTRSFKGRVKTGLTRIFIHENIYIYIK